MPSDRRHSNLGRRSTDTTTELERESLEAHVDLCALRYSQLESRLDSVERKIDSITADMHEGAQGLIKVIVGAAGTVVAGLLSVVIVILMN